MSDIYQVYTTIINFLRFPDAGAAATPARALIGRMSSRVRVGRLRLVGGRVTGIMMAGIGGLSGCGCQCDRDGHRLTVAGAVGGRASQRDRSRVASVPDNLNPGRRRRGPCQCRARRAW